MRARTTERGIIFRPPPVMHASQSFEQPSALKLRLFPPDPTGWARVSPRPGRRARAWFLSLRCLRDRRRRAVLRRRPRHRPARTDDLATDGRPSQDETEARWPVSLGVL